MSDVIPTGSTRDSEFLFERMTRATLDGTRPRPGARILDVASGFGQDAFELAGTGAHVVGVEPSQRMSAWARLGAARLQGSQPCWVRAWSDGLPFASRSFDGVFCKGALDHFDRPAEAIAEMARVTRPDGCVVLAVANFESLACRVARFADDVREDWLERAPRRGRRHYDVPADHFTRYDLALMRDQASRSLVLERVEGISLGWGLPTWARAVERLPASLARAALGGLDWIARRAPGLADVVVLRGRPRTEPALSPAQAPG